MNKEASPNIFLSYIKDKRKILLLAAVWTLAMGVTYWLYALPWEPFVYGAAICLAAGLLAAVIDGYGYWSRHRNLLRLSQKAQQGIPDFAAPRNLEEADYVNLLKKVWQEKENCVMEARRERQESLDYYTLWTHQAKTPIAAMGLMLQGQDTPMSQSLRAELFKTEQYVEMALSYVRLGSGATDYVFRKYSLDDLVRQAVRKYASLFIQKKIKLNLQPLGVYVVTDEKWLTFALGQILSNALKYTGKGSISIRCHTESALVIEDTGIGIAPEDLPRIWDKGFTGYNGRKDKRATGIGLYLCKRILENLSHTIWVESRLGEGTKVYIDFYKKNGNFVKN